MVRRTHGNSQEHVTKHIFVTGGVVSSLGKGLTASSLGRLLRSRGIHVLQQKLDPYINVDPGTMNPFQHGEVYVTEDGAETDLDIGHYERFLDVFLSQKANVTTGQIYQEVLRKERAGEYLGQCVQVIPHITNEIKSRMRAQASDDVDVIITEIGGTVGDIESQPFDPIAGAGSFAVLPRGAEEILPSDPAELAEIGVEVLPEGTYLCMSRWGMPYEPEVSAPSWPAWTGTRSSPSAMLSILLPGHHELRRVSPRGLLLYPNPRRPQITCGEIVPK